MRTAWAVSFLVLTALRAEAAPCEDLQALVLPNASMTASVTVPAGTFRPLDRSADAAQPFVLAPAFCRVTATLKPSRDSDIKIEVWLPTENWNGKFLGIGNDSWAGQISYAALARNVTRGYAAAATDAGHTGNTAAFAPGHPDKVVDMGYRAVHEMTVAAKAVIGAFYDTPSTLALWNACSNGGRQGITEAVRYPEDFDAIVAGAPAVNWIRVHAGRMAMNQAVNRTASRRIPPEKYPLIHNAVLDACDANDGVKDGVLEDPRACRFDPQVLECKGKEAPGCLTAPQVDAARAFYAPVTHPSTGDVIMPGLEKGSELGWGTLGGPQPFYNALEAFKYVVFENEKWDWRRFNLAADLDLAETIDRGILASSDADLRPFFARGGKLLMYQGWSDPQIPPGNTVDFFDRIVAAAGRDAVGASVQLYMVPGMNHCAGGAGTDAFDAFAAIEQWIASGSAPERIDASRIANGTVERTRPLCPYGQVAKWDGVGAANEAASFACVAP